MKKTKTILLVLLLIYLIFAIFNSRYTSIEEKILDDTNTGGSINADMTDELFVVDEASEDFYVCVGETTSGRICVLSIQYKSSGFSHANKQRISKSELFDEDRRTLTVNNQKIVYGFTNTTEQQMLEIDGRSVEFFTFDYTFEDKTHTVGFWYYLT